MIMSRPLTIADLDVEQTNDAIVQSVPKFQQNFGHTKRIKPWRTGTKSQQQPAPKGHTKGFRK